MNVRSTLKRAILATFIAGSMGVSASADPLYWDASTSSVWGINTNWNVAANGSGLDPVAAPGVNDNALFNVSTLLTAQTVNLQADVAVKGIEFVTNGAVTLQSNNNNRLLTIGSDGITKSANLVTNVGSAGSGARLNLRLAGSQTWQNNSTVATAILNINAGTSAAMPATATPTTLTLGGSNTGLNILTSSGTGNVTLSDNTAAGVLSVVKDGPGTWTFQGGLPSTYTGGFTINGGLFSHGYATNASGFGTGTVTLNGGEIRGGTNNITVTNAVNVTANSTISPTRMDLTSGLTTFAMTGAFTSSGTPGNGPVLTVDQHNIATPPTVTLGSASWTGFNGTLNLKTSQSSAGTYSFPGTTAAGSELLNTKVIIDTINNSTIGASRVDILGGTSVFKAGELSGSGYMAFRGSTVAAPYTLEVGHLGTNSTFSGDIRHFQTAGAAGVLSLNKVGTGSLTLTGNNDYTGGTNIVNGTLIVGANAGLTTILPTEFRTQLNGVDANSVFTANTVTGATTFAPTAHGLVSGDRVTIYRNLAAADYLANNNKTFYVKSLTNETFELYNSYDGVTFSDKALFTAVTPVVASSLPGSGGVRITMGTALGASSSAIALGSGTDSNSVSLLAGTATAPSVTIARAVNVAANSGGTSTIGSTVDGNSVFSGAISLGKNANITSASAGLNTLTVSGVISGAGFGISKVGTGNATLSGANTYTGSTKVEAGTLSFANKAAYYSSNAGGEWSDSSGAKLVVNSGATAGFTIGGVGEFNESDIATINANGSATGGFLAGSNLGLNPSVPTYTYGTVITNASGNSIGLVKLGANELVLNQANSYTGNTTVSAGTLTVGANVGISTNGPLGNSASAIRLGDANAINNVSLLTNGAFTIARDINVTSGGTGFATIGGSTNHNSTFSGTITLGKDTNLTSVATGGNELLVSGKITGSAHLHKVGSGVATLSSAANDMSSLVWVDAGTLRVTGSHNMGTANGAYVVGFGATNNGTLEITGTLNSAPANAGEYSMEIGTFGTGVVNQLAGSSVTFGGAAGIIAIADDGVAGVGTYNLKGGTLDVAAGGVGKIMAGPGTANFNFTGGTLKVKLFNPTDLAGSFVGGGLTQTNADGPSILDVTGNNTVITGNYDLTGGTANIGASRTLTAGTVLLKGGAAINGPGSVAGTAYDVQSGSASAALTGTGGLTKSTGGTVTLSGTNTYTGNTTVSAGTLNITGNHTTGANYSVASGANLNTKNVRVTNALTVDGTATITANGGTAGASKVESLTIGAGGKLNLKDNDLVVGTAPNFNAVRTAIIAGKTNNAASGITSDVTGFGISRGFGYAMGNDPKVSSLLAGSLAGQTYDADSVLVKYTLLGDADLDGDTDLNDLGLWSNGYTGDLGVTTSPTTFWTGGDFDYDGDTDLNDLGLWSSTYTGDFNGGPGSLVVNAPNASPEAVAILNSMGFTVVPEPSTFVLAGVGLAGLAIAARRRKK